MFLGLESGIRAEVTIRDGLGLVYIHYATGDGEGRDGEGSDGTMG